MTLLNLKVSFHALVSEFPWETSDVALVIGWFNDGQKDVARKTKCLKKYSYTPSVKDQQEYDLSTLTGFLEIDRQGGVTYDGLRLDPVTIDELDFTKAKWRNADSGTPKYYYKRGKYIGLYPKPSETGKSIGVYCSYMPTDMANSGDQPFDGVVEFVPYHDLPLLYAIGLAKFGKGQFATKELALAEYTARMTAMKNELYPEDEEKSSMKGDPFLRQKIKARHGL